MLQYGFLNFGITSRNFQTYKRTDISQKYLKVKDDASLFLMVLFHKIEPIRFSKYSDYYVILSTFTKFVCLVSSSSAICDAFLTGEYFMWLIFWVYLRFSVTFSDISFFLEGKWKVLASHLHFSVFWGISVLLEGKVLASPLHLSVFCGISVLLEGKLKRSQNS